MAPTVSAVVVTYNFGAYLARALDSVLAQELPADEIIVVDDGSTDDTPSVVERYADRVRYVRTENRGHLAAFDRGIAEASGDYIALLDGDDEWLPHKLRAQVELLEARPDLGLVHGDMRVVDADGAVLAESFFAERGIEHVDGDLLWALVRHNTITTSALMVRGALRDRFHPIPDWARVQDWWISLCVAEVAGIGCLREPVTLYRRHGANLNHGRSGRRRGELLRAELPLRRRLLTGSAMERLGGADAAAALTAFERAIEGAGEALGLRRRELLSADRAAGEARALAARDAVGDPDAAARHLVAALAHDPWNATARSELVVTGRRGGWIAAPSVAVGAPAGPPPQTRVEGAKGFATLASASEVIAAPELLAAYAGAVGAEDDATLVIRVDGGPETFGELAEAVAGAGLERDDAADLLAVPAEQSLGFLAARVDALLSGSLPDGPLAALPCVDASGVAALGGAGAGGRRWCINICAPNWWSARSWGDLHFARAIQQELHRRGELCAIHVMDQWESSRDADRFDVVLHLKGLSTYEPNPAQHNLLWNISHPDLLTAEECDRADLVLVASEAFARTMRERTSTPIEVLEQATDPAVFHPDPDPAHEHDLVFVGNSRRVMRRVLADLLPTPHDLAVWGGDWDGLIDPSLVAGTFLPNHEVRRAYSSAAIVLNDHWDDMREHGFASNRLYDAVACGALVISDRVDGLEERFAGAVVTYETAEDLRALVEHFLARPEERAARGAAGRELVLGRDTFAHRVDALLTLTALRLSPTRRHAAAGAAR